MDSRYRLGRVLSDGAYGDIVVAKQLETDKDVCVKKIFMGTPHSEQRRILQKKALQEAHMLSRVEHPMIISYIETVYTDNTVYVVTELGKFGSLRDMLVKELNVAGKDPMFWSENTVLSYFGQICLAVKHLHNDGMIHRDIKCENVFLTGEHTCKLGDFGLSMKLAKGEKVNFHCGSPYQMAPEITLSRDYDAAVDVWALGVVLYELCSGGEYPFRGNTTEEIFERVRSAECPGLNEIYSAELQSLFQSMLSKDPAQRPTIDTICELPFMKSSIANIVDDLHLAAKFDPSGKFIGEVTDSKARGKRDLDAIVEKLRGEAQSTPTGSGTRRTASMTPLGLSLAQATTPTSAVPLATKVNAFRKQHGGLATKSYSSSSLTTTAGTSPTSSAATALKKYSSSTRYISTSTVRPSRI